MAILSTLRLYTTEDEEINQIVKEQNLKKLPKSHLKALVNEIEESSNMINTFLFQSAYMMAKNACKKCILAIDKLQESDPNLTEDIFHMYTLKKIDAIIHLGISYNCLGDYIRSAEQYSTCCIMIKRDFDIRSATIWQNLGIATMGLADAYLQRDRLSKCEQVMKEYRALVVQQFGPMAESIVLGMQQFKFYVTRHKAEMALVLAKRLRQLYISAKPRCDNHLRPKVDKNGNVQTITKWELNAVEAKNRHL